LSNCVYFADKRCFILQQDDFSMTRLIYDSFIDLNATRNDVPDARHIAHALGIHEQYIVHLHNATAKEINDHLNNLKRYNRENLRGLDRLLFVYVASHGCADQ